MLNNLNFLQWMKSKVIKNVQINPSFLKDDWEYLDYYSEDEYLESSPDYKAKYITVKVFEEGRLKIKRVQNLDINKINSQSIFSVKFDFRYWFRLLEIVINWSFQKI